MAKPPHRPNRPELERAINGLGTGYVLVLAEWDRCTRSMIDGIDIIERLHARGALIKVLDKPKGFLAFLSALAQDECGTGPASPLATWWMQVHNLLDWQVHLATLRGWKKEGRAPFNYTNVATDIRNRFWGFALMLGERDLRHRRRRN